MLHQTKHAQGILTPPVPYCAGMVATAVFEHTFNAAYTAASDKIEMGLLPATAQIISAVVVGANIGALTADVGLMSGEPGDDDDTRTVGSELFNDQSVNNTEKAATQAACLAVAPANTHRGIGATISGDVAAGATKKLTVVVSYTY